jgi:hypothetical protein
MPIRRGRRVTRTGPTGIIETAETTRNWEEKAKCVVRRRLSMIFHRIPRKLLDERRFGVFVSSGLYLTGWGGHSLSEGTKLCREIEQIMC